MSPGRRALLVTTPTAGALAIVVLFWSTRGITTVVRNTGNVRMDDFRILVTGREYRQSDLRSGEVRRVLVQATGESGIELTYAEQGGRRRSIDLGLYIEQGYTGEVSIDVAEDSVVRKTSDVSP